MRDKKGTYQGQKRNLEETKSEHYQGQKNNNYIYQGQKQTFYF